MARLTPTELAPVLPIVAVTASRALGAADHGKELRCTRGITLTVDAGLPSGFVCRVSVAPAVGSSLIWQRLDPVWISGQPWM